MNLLIIIRKLKRQWLLRCSALLGIWSIRIIRSLEQTKKREEGNMVFPCELEISKLGQQAAKHGIFHPAGVGPLDAHAAAVCDNLGGPAGCNKAVSDKSNDSTVLFPKWIVNAHIEYAKRLLMPNDPKLSHAAGDVNREADRPA